MTIKEFLKHRRLVQFLEYAVGGGLYFVVGYAIFAICYSGLNWPWWIGKLIGDVVGWTLNFLVQRYWAFNTKRLYKHEWAARWRYIAFTVMNIGLDYLIIASLREMGISPYIGMIVAGIFFTGWNYLGYRFWVFGKPPHIHVPHPHTSAEHARVEGHESDHDTSDSKGV